MLSSVLKSCSPAHINAGASAMFRISIRHGLYQVVLQILAKISLSAAILCAATICSDTGVCLHYDSSTAISLLYLTSISILHLLWQNSTYCEVRHIYPLKTAPLYLASSAFSTPTNIAFNFSNASCSATFHCYRLFFFFRSSNRLTIVA